LSEKKRINLDDSVRLLKILSQQPRLSCADIGRELEISESTVKRMFKKLEALGVVIENIGSRKKPHYVIVRWGMIDPNTFCKTPHIAGDISVHLA